jgi:hypothetical protein
MRNLAFSSNGSPQIRWRAASKHSEEVEGIADECDLAFGDVKANFAEFRAAVWAGAKFVVRSGRYAVLMDRHPACPADVIESHLKHVRSKARSSLSKKTLKIAKKTLEIVEAQRSDGRRIINLLDQLDGVRMVDEPTLKMLRSIAVRMAGDNIVAERNRPNATHLERFEIGQ